jgi:hypothetical protein
VVNKVVRKSKEGKLNRKERVSHEKRMVKRRWWYTKGQEKPALQPWEEVKRQRMISEAERLLKEEKSMLKCTNHVKELATRHKKRIILIEKCLFELYRPNMDRAIEIRDIIETMYLPLKTVSE